MRRLAILTAGAIAPMIATAEAGVTVIYDYSAVITAGSATGDSATIGPDFPAGGVQQVSDFNSSEGNPDAYAAATGFGTGADGTEAVSFAAGAASAGNASSAVTLTARIIYTNDTDTATNVSFNSLIFGGGVGVGLPDFSANNCDIAAISQCQTYFFPDSGASIDQIASLAFSLDLLDGDTPSENFFSGDVTVGPGGNSANFNDIALTNFGTASDNENYFVWNDTEVNDISIGVVPPGDSRTLEFSISLLTFAPFGFDTMGCDEDQFQCAIAQAGFGDPWSDTGGVVIFASLPDGRNPTFEILASPVPVPPALILFPLGIAALGARKRHKAQHSEA